LLREQRSLDAALAVVGDALDGANVEVLGRHWLLVFSLLVIGGDRSGSVCVLGLVLSLLVFFPD
jgi:hypothetical protein